MRGQSAASDRHGALASGPSGSTLATFDPPLLGPQRIRVAAQRPVALTALTPVGPVAVPLWRGAVGWWSLVCADEPLGALRCEPLGQPGEGAELTINAEAVAMWQRLRPDIAVGGLRFPAGQPEHIVDAALRFDDAHGRTVTVRKADGVALAGRTLHCGPGGAVWLQCVPSLPRGRVVFEVRGWAPSSAGHRQSLRPYVVSAQGRLVRLRRVATDFYAATIDLRDAADGLVFVPRLRPGPVELDGLTVRTLSAPGLARQAVRRWVFAGQRRVRGLLAPALRGAPAAAVKPVEWAPDAVARTAIVVATKDAPQHLATFLKTVKPARDAGAGLVLVDNGSADETALALLAAAAADGATVLRDARAFNFSALNNLGAAHTDRDFLVFANNDLSFDGAAWLSALLAPLQAGDAGVTGGRLLYPGGRVQHGGIALCADGHATHLERGNPRRDGGASGRQRGVSRVCAVTGALLAVRADLFRALGGFDPMLPVHMNDVDFCLRVRATGQHVLFVGGAEAVHHESATIGAHSRDDPVARGGAHWAMMREREAAIMHERWAPLFANDPYYPAWLAPEEGLFVPRQTSVLIGPREGAHHG